MKLTRWLFILGLAGFFAVEGFGQAATAAAPGATTNVGTIQAKRVVGNVSAKTAATGATVGVANDAYLSAGQVISTGAGASAVLIFSNGASVSLAANSELDIQAFLQDPFTAAPGAVSSMTDEPSRSTTKIKLTKGELVGKVAHLNTGAGSSFTVATPVGAAGIRGTTFRIVYTPTGTGNAFNFALTTLEGDVVMQVATGTVTIPVSVTDNKEITLTGDVTTNAAGQVVVTITPPAGSTGSGATLVLTSADASAGSLSTLTTSATEIANAGAGVIISAQTTQSTTNSGGDGTPPPPLPPTPPPTEPPPTPPTTPPPPTPPPTPTSPPIVPTAPQTTPGAGLP